MQDLIDRRVQSIRVLASCCREMRLTATTALDQLGGVFHQFPGVQAFRYQRVAEGYH